MGFWDKLLKIDRRWIFLCIGLAVLVPYLSKHATFIQGTPTPETRAVYEYVEQLPPGSVVMISFDYGPAGMPEMQPMAMAMVRQCFRQHLRVIAIALNPQGVPMADEVFKTVSQEYHTRYGTDYANLGFKPGGLAVILGMGSAFHGVYPQDTRGLPLDALPVMKGVINFDQVALLLTLATSGTPGTWIAFAHQRFHVSLALGITAVMATDYYPYYQTGQVVGILNGMRGAADYENLVGHPDRGVLGMGPQSVAHLVIILFVVLGNVGYFASRRSRQR